MKNSLKNTTQKNDVWPTRPISRPSGCLFDSSFDSLLSAGPDPFDSDQLPRHRKAAGAAQRRDSVLSVAEKSFAFVFITLVLGSLLAHILHRIGFMVPRGAEHVLLAGAVAILALGAGAHWLMSLVESRLQAVLAPMLAHLDLRRSVSEEAAFRLYDERIGHISTAASYLRGQLSAGVAPNAEVGRLLLESSRLCREAASSSLSMKARFFVAPRITHLMIEVAELRRLCSLYGGEPSLGGHDNDAADGPRVAAAKRPLSLREVVEGKLFYPVAVRKIAQDGPMRKKAIPMGAVILVMGPEGEDGLDKHFKVRLTADGESLYINGGLCQWELAGEEILLDSAI